MLPPIPFRVEPCDLAASSLAEFAPPKVMSLWALRHGFASQDKLREESPIHANRDAFYAKLRFFVTHLHCTKRTLGERVHVSFLTPSRCPSGE